MMSPWQLIGTLHNQDKDAHDPIVDLAFNAMNTHLLSIHYSVSINIIYEEHLICGLVYCFFLKIKWSLK